jgi:hypothetical protein
MGERASSDVKHMTVLKFMRAVERCGYTPVMNESGLLPVPTLFAKRQTERFVQDIPERVNLGLFRDSQPMAALKGVNQTLGQSRPGFGAVGITQGAEDVYGAGCHIL